MRFAGMLLVFPVFLATALCLTLPSEGDGCAAPHRQGDYVHIAEESAVIVWDAASKTQHFIRRATFDTKAKDFGFLVPTPAQPALADVDDAVFSFLDAAIRPRIVDVSGGFEFGSLCCMCCPLPGKLGLTRSATGVTPPPVRVLDSQRVGGFDAVVLEADDAQALNDWLKERGYPSDPELVSWLGPYVAEKWKITAFKIAPDAKAGASVRTSAVRMSFKTDKPFFPYREPNQPEVDKNAAFSRGPRMLRVFFVSASRTTAKRGAGAWSARVPWADTLNDEQRARLIKDLGVPADHIPAAAWLTTFEDTSTPRPAADEVFFEASQEQTSVRPPDIQRRGTPIWIPADMVILGVVLLASTVFLVVRYVRRSKPERP
jgi:Uncharacterized protein conserved in bacteria (DUF2330)